MSDTKGGWVTPPHLVARIVDLDMVTGIESTLVNVPGWDRSMPRTLEYWSKRGHHR